MYLYIDAYNLIGSLSFISLQDKQKEEHLLTYLLTLDLSAYKNVIVVFDGNRAYNQYQVVSQRGGVTVVTTDVLISADDYIIEAVNKKSLLACMVVTSDKGIRNAIKKRTVRLLSSCAFSDYFLEKRSEAPQSSLDAKLELDFWADQFNAS